MNQAARTFVDFGSSAASGIVPVRVRMPCRRWMEYHRRLSAILAEPCVEVLRDERIVVKVRVRRIHAIDLRELTWR